MLRNEIENLLVEESKSGNFEDTTQEIEEIFLENIKENLSDDEIAKAVFIDRKGRFGADVAKEIVNLLEEYVSKSAKHIFLSGNYQEQKLPIPLDMIDCRRPVSTFLKLECIHQLVRELKRLPILGKINRESGMLIPNQEGIKEYMREYPEFLPSKL